MHTTLFILTMTYFLILAIPMRYAEIDATFNFDSVQLVSVVHFGRGRGAQQIRKLNHYVEILF